MEVYNEIYLEQKDIKNLNDEETKDQPLNEIEILKQTEYKSHPLYTILLSFSQQLQS